VPSRFDSSSVYRKLKSLLGTDVAFLKTRPEELRENIGQFARLYAPTFQMTTRKQPGVQARIQALNPP
jgi:hypothetical protein